MDKVRARGFDTDMAIAARLGRSRQVVSQWRSGGKFPEDDTVIELAKLAGEKAGPWLVLVQSERSSGQAGKEWAEIARKMGAAAALVLLVGAASMPLPAAAKAPGLYIMSIQR